MVVEVTLARVPDQCWREAEPNTRARARTHPGFSISCYRSNVRSTTTFRSGIVSNQDAYCFDICVGTSFRADSMTSIRDGGKRNLLRGKSPLPPIGGSRAGQKQRGYYSDIVNEGARQELGVGGLCQEIPTRGTGTRVCCVDRTSILGRGRSRARYGRRQRTDTRLQVNTIINDKR